MRLFSLLLISSMILSASQVAEARVFSFKSETVAAYFSGSAGPSAVGTDTFREAGGNGTTY